MSYGVFTYSTGSRTYFALRVCVSTSNYYQDDLGSKYEGLQRYRNRSVSYYMHVHNWYSPELFVGVDSGKLSNFAFPSQRPYSVVYNSKKNFGDSCGHQIVDATVHQL